MTTDPAFLFYSKDFYEGTRMMLPEERACLIDLMIYQQQHGLIPKDLKRVLMYCTGVTEATLEATLEAKFRFTGDGWINDKQAKVISDREEFTAKQSVNGTIGQFWKKAKAILKKAKYAELKDLLYDNTNNEIFELIKDKEINEAMLEAMLIAKPKHLAIANEDEIEDVSLNKEKFEIFRLAYKGTKRGLDTEFENFIKKNNSEIINMLLPALEKEIAHKQKLIEAKQFCPEWKNLQTWINQKCWEQEFVEAKGSNYGEGEYKNSTGNRTYGTSGVIVPNDAPPRPSNQHIWSKNEAKWKIQ